MDNIIIMKQFRYLYLFTGLLIFPSCSNKNNEKPNLIFILTDDQGSVDVNSYGATDLATPNMDKLINDGVKFTRFYVGSPICSPSRATLLTGRTPHSAGVPGNVSSIPGKEGMPTEQFTIAEMMRNAGYSTGHVGKWHLGYSEKTVPLAQGFDYSFGHMGGCIDNYSHYFYWNPPNRHDLWENGTELFNEGEFFPDMMNEKAESFIRKHKKEPFFLYYAINVPHYPLQPTKKWRDYYSDMEMPRRDYAAFVSTADENIGKLIDILDELKIRDNTIIIFMSDHGHSYEARTFGGGGSAGPFRGGKFSLFDGGIRVPACISWKGIIPAGVVRNQVVHSIDILPTIASLCNIDEIPESVEGIDISEAIIENVQLKSRTLHWKLYNQWAVLYDNWKLIGNPIDPSGGESLDNTKDRLFLSSMLIDSTETINLAEKYPKKVEELLVEYFKWEHSSPEDTLQTK